MSIITINHRASVLVEVVGAADPALAERTLRDFARPFGMMAQVALKSEAFGA